MHLSLQCSVMQFPNVGKRGIEYIIGKIILRLTKFHSTMTFLSQNDHNSMYRYIVCIMLYLILSALIYIIQ